MASCSAVAGAMLLATLLASCRAAPISQHRRWADALIRSLNSHRREQFIPVFGAPATYEDPLTNGPRSGPSLVYYWSLMFEAFPSLRYEITRVNDTDQITVVEWVLHGVGAGTSPPPINGVFVIAFNGDAIGAVRAYFDARPFGIGVLSPAPTAPAS